MVLIKIEGAKSFIDSGGESFDYISYLNDNDNHVQFQWQRIMDHACGWPELTYEEYHEHQKSIESGREFAIKLGAV